MTPSVEQRWNHAQSCERAGDRAGARAEYEALLAMDAGFVPAHLRLSRHAQWAGRYRIAHRHVLDAADSLRLGTGSARHLAPVSQRLLDFGETSEAASAVLSADWTDPVVLRQAPSLAQCLWLAGRYADALRFLDAAEPRLAPDALLRLTRGNVLRYLGHLEDAERCYMASLALRPALGDAHWAMATLSSAPPSPGWVRDLLAVRAAMTQDTTVTDRAHIAYAAFHAFDRAGREAQAWDALEEGMRLMHAQLRPDMERRADRIESLMTSGISDAGSPAPANGQPRPVFIVGLPRTGTTLLDRILGNHGWVTSVGERNDLSAAASEVLDRFFTTQADADPQVEWRDGDAARVGHLYRQRLRALAPATALAVDKNPRNLFNLPLILEALPEAKVLVLQRDPMDAAFSNLKELFQGGSYPYSYGFADVASEVALAARWSRHWADRSPESVRLVHYESLVRNTGAEVEGILRFLGLGPEPGLASLERNQAPVATASSAQVRGAIHERGIGAWQRYASQLAPLHALIDGRA